MAKKETIKPPTVPVVKLASKELQKGSRLAGRVMADESVAVRQGASKSAKKK